MLKNCRSNIFLKRQNMQVMVSYTSLSTDLKSGPPLQLYPDLTPARLVCVYFREEKRDRVESVGRGRRIHHSWGTVGDCCLESKQWTDKSQSEQSVRQRESSDSTSSRSASNEYRVQLNNKVGAISQETQDWSHQLNLSLLILSVAVQYVWCKLWCNEN